jgi:hypothetical protein
MQTALLVAAPALLIGVLSWPMLFTSGVPGEDWATHLWDMWNQSLALRTNHLPSLFIDYSHSVFYPEYAFYGGTLYAVVGTLSLLLGDAPIGAYVASYLMAFAAAYGGWHWMARMAGLGRWRAHVPGLVFITSAYYLTLIYARGDWPEFVGVSMIPLLIASGLSVLCTERLQIWPALALAASGILFFGSHNLTLVWGSTALALTGAAVVVWVPEARRWLTPRRVLRVAGLLIPALLVSAWFLLPAIAYQAHTEIGSRYLHWRLVLKAAMYMVSAHNLFTISRASFKPGADFALSLPILAMVWSLASICVFGWRRSLRGPWAKVLLICAAMMVLAIVVMTHAAIILALGQPYAMLQYSYRLESYVLLDVSGTVLAALALAQQSSPRMRWWAWTVAPVLIVALVGAIQQTDARTRGGNRDQMLVPGSGPGPRERGFLDYIDADLPVLQNPQGRWPEVDFSVAGARTEHVSAVVHLPPRSFIDSNVGGGPELIHVAGAKIVGTSPDGNDVLELGAGASSARAASGGGGASTPTEVITLTPAGGLPVLLGRLISLAAAIVLVAELAALAVRGTRARRRHCPASKEGPDVC